MKKPLSSPDSPHHGIAKTILANSLGRALSGNFGLPGIGRRKKHASTPGSPPGIESMVDLNTQPLAGSVGIQCIDYGPDSVQQTEVTNLLEFLQSSPVQGTAVRWINVNGLHPWVVDQFRQHYRFHTLAAEDVLRTPQRPKLEDYDDYLFIVMHMMTTVENCMNNEQISLFVFPGLILTFQERAGDVWDPLRQRLKNANSRLRKNDASYLLYSLLDAIIDHCFPILEQYGDRLEDLEDRILNNTHPHLQRELHTIKRELALLRRILWPTRELILTLLRPETEEISAYAKHYMRDVYDHGIQVMDILETYREMAASLNDLYMSAVSNRMNEIMKVLTLMASFFIPTTFIAGVYGMNFEHMPELAMTYGYAGFWTVTLSVFATMALYFWRKGWFGK